MPTDPCTNLVTKTALDIADLYNTKLPNLNVVIRLFEPCFVDTQHMKNRIPLGRGLGSSGAAIVGGIAMASIACGLNLSMVISQ